MYDYQRYEDFWNNPISDYKRLLEPYLIPLFTECKTSNILEVGFGSGHLATVLENTGFTGHYTGIDIDPQAVDFATRHSYKDNIRFDVFTDYSSLKNQAYDLVVFCLSACEMSDDILKNYLKNLNTQKLIIINPSTTTNYFHSNITKPWVNRLLSRLGQQPKWRMLAHIPDPKDQKRLYYINNDHQIPASMYYRSTGDLLNICKSQAFEFERYQDLKYTENTVKTAPVSKFEVLIFDGKKS
jgi:SAM-dependent methyltransferase